VQQTRKRKEKNCLWSEVQHPRAKWMRNTRQYTYRMQVLIHNPKDNKLERTEYKVQLTSIRRGRNSRNKSGERCASQNADLWKTTAQLAHMTAIKITSLTLFVMTISRKIVNKTKRLKAVS
jgi:hypothetical protein